jgi:hypothetical protein
MVTEEFVAEPGAAKTAQEAAEEPASAAVSSASTVETATVAIPSNAVGQWSLFRSDGVEISFVTNWRTTW